MTYTVLNPAWSFIMTPVLQPRLQCCHKCWISADSNCCWTGLTNVGRCILWCGAEVSLRSAQSYCGANLVGGGCFWAFKSGSIWIWSLACYHHRMCSTTVSMVGPSTTAASTPPYLLPGLSYFPQWVEAADTLRLNRASIHSLTHRREVGGGRETAKTNGCCSPLPREEVLVWKRF